MSELSPHPNTEAETAMMHTSDLLRAAILCGTMHPNKLCEYCTPWWLEIDLRLPRRRT